jgi:hypothetical protein
MIGVLILSYSSMPKGFEHQALSTVLLNFEQFLRPLMPYGVSQSLKPTVLFSGLASSFISCFNEKYDKFWHGNLMDVDNVYLLRLQEIAEEVCTIQSRVKELEAEIRIEVRDLLDERECLLSRVDPYSDSGNSLADWISE